MENNCMKPDELRIAVVGHIDHGKSTLVGQLLLQAGAVPREDSLHAPPSDASVAFVTDQLSEERRRGITLDSAQAVLRTRRRAIVLIDTPGHAQLLSNTLSGAAWAEAAVLVVDATCGPQAQTQAHLQLLALLGIRRIVVAVNKMDLVDYQNAVFRQCAQASEVVANAEGISVEAAVPVSALTGNNLIDVSGEMSWHRTGPLLTALEAITVVHEETRHLAACLPVQQRLEHEGSNWVLGRIEGGQVACGKWMRAWPVGSMHVVRRIIVGTESVTTARTGQCAAVELEPVGGLARGAVLVSERSPLRPLNQLELWALPLHEKLPVPGEELDLRGQVVRAKVEVVAVGGPAADPSGKTFGNMPGASSGPHGVRVWVRPEVPIVLDTSGRYRNLHRVLLSRNDQPCIAGVVRQGTAT